MEAYGGTITSAADSHTGANNADLIALEGSERVGERGGAGILTSEIRRGLKWQRDLMRTVPLHKETTGILVYASQTRNLAGLQDYTKTLNESR